MALSSDTHEDISGWHGHMIWSDMFFLGIVGVSAVSWLLVQRGSLLELWAPPSRCFASACMFYAIIRHKELCQHDGLSPYGPWDCWVTDSVFWKQPVNQPWLLIIVLFAGLFLSQISSPVQLAGSCPKAFSSRAEGQSKSLVGGRERN